MRRRNTVHTVEGDRGPGGAAQAPETLYNRWKRWSDMGVFARMMQGLAAESAEQATVMIDATDLKAHRTASSLRLKKGGVGV
jgi:hypothetical protein